MTRQWIRGGWVMAVLVGVGFLSGRAHASQPLEQFGYNRNAAISGYNNEHLSGVTAADCASECLSRGWCKSFDFHKASNACDLSERSAVDVGLKTDYSGNPYDHYSVLPAEFTRTANAAISGYNNEHLTGVMPAQCAQACEARGWCKSFDYYKSTRECDLSASEVGGLKTDYAGHPYDHYAYTSSTKFLMKNIGRNQYLNVNDEGNYWPADFRLQDVGDERWVVGDTSYGPNVKTFTTTLASGYCSNGYPSTACPDSYRLCAYNSSGFRARISLSDDYVGTPSSWNSPECAWIVEDLGNGEFKLRSYWLETAYGSYPGYLRCNYYYDCTFDYASGTEATTHWRLE